MGPWSYAEISGRHGTKVHFPVLQVPPTIRGGSRPYEARLPRGAKASAGPETQREEKGSESGRISRAGDAARSFVRVPAKDIEVTVERFGFVNN